MIDLLKNLIQKTIDTYNLDDSTEHRRKLEELEHELLCVKAWDASSEAKLIKLRDIVLSEIKVYCDAREPAWVLLKKKSMSLDEFLHLNTTHDSYACMLQNLFREVEHMVKLHAPHIDIYQVFADNSMLNRKEVVDEPDDQTFLHIQENLLQKLDNNSSLTEAHISYYKTEIKRTRNVQDLCLIEDQLQAHQSHRDNVN